MDQKRIKIAIHETGHAIMALRYGQAIQKVSLREMESPKGTDNYKAFVKLEPGDPNTKFTGEKAIQKIMISLGGYASEILFSGFAGIGGDDLTEATRLSEELLRDEGFKNWVAGLPIPEPSELDMIKNPMTRSYIHFKLGECIKILGQVKPAIQIIAEELYKREELTGDEVSTLFSSFMYSRINADQNTVTKGL